MASRLYEVLNNIETSRKLCIENAKLANLNANNNMNFTDIANLFLLKNTPGTIHGWERPSDWWDCETILDNAENRTDSGGNTVYPASIILMDDTNKTTTFNKTGTPAMQGDAYLTSDGAWYGTTTATHTWDQTKDKPCSDGYKTRYVIVYTKTPETSVAINLSTFECLEVILGDITCTLQLSYNQKIQNISATNKTKVSVTASSSLSNNTALARISFPNVASLPYSCFGYCSRLCDVNLPNLVSVSGASVFSNCFALTHLSLPSLTTMGNSMFSGCSSLTTISLPSLTAIPNNAFGSLYSLTNLELPNVTSIVGNAFSGCSSLTYVSLPNLKSISGVTNFNASNALLTFTIPNTIETISTSNTNPIFSASLKSLILPNDFELDLNLQYDTGFTHSALVDMIDKLKDFSNDNETHTLQLGATNLAKLSSDEIAVGTAKGWTIS